MTDDLASVVWRRVDVDVLEHASLARAGEGLLVEGALVGVVEGLPLRTRYRVECDAAFRARALRVDRLHGHARSALEVRVDGERWLVDGRERPELHGCVGVDLGGTPITNTLAIRALGLPVSGSGVVAVAWTDLDPPAPLALERATQRYTRLGDGRYRYEALVDGRASDAFEIEVDALGLVRRYQGLWERLACDHSRSQTNG